MKATYGLPRCAIFQLRRYESAIIVSDLIFSPLSACSTTAGVSPPSLVRTLDVAAGGERAPLPQADDELDVRVVAPLLRSVNHLPSQSLLTSARFIIV